MKSIKLTIILLILMLLVGCGNDNSSQQTTDAVGQEQTAGEENQDATQSIPTTDPSYWSLRGSDRTGYVMVPYNWTEQEYEYELEKNYSLMLISPERNAMVSLIENNYGYDPKQYDSQEPGKYILEAYIDQYETQGGQNLSVENVEINGYTFYKSTDCYPAGVYADYDYYLHTYVTFTGDRFYTIVVEGEQGAIADVITKLEESFSATGQ